MGDMSFQETAERWTDGLQKAASRCRELGAAQDKKLIWDKIAESLDGIRKSGETVIVTKALSRKEILESVDRRVGAKYND